MSIINRIKKIFSSNVNDLLDKVEDPEKMLEQYLIDMQEDYEQAKNAVATSIASKNMIENNYNKKVEEVKKWEENAVLALERGETSLAEQALQRQIDAERLRDTYKSQLDIQANEVEELKSVLRQLEERIVEAKNKKEMLITKSKNAKAQEKVNSTMSKISSNINNSGFERMEDKIEKSYAESKAMAELNSNSLEDKFDALKSDKNVEVSNRLAELKEKMNKKN